MEQIALKFRRNKKNTSRWFPKICRLNFVIKLNKYFRTAFITQMKLTNRKKKGMENFFVGRFYSLSRINKINNTFLNSKISCMLDASNLIHYLYLHATFTNF